MQAETIRFLYRFIPKMGETKEIELLLDPATMRSEVRHDAPLPDWTRMDFHACEGCEWKETEHCPVAIRLMQPLELFADVVSHQPASVEVETPARNYYKDLDMQQGLSSLFGLLMATSGCPALAAFRPMTRYHLPFATFEETFFRIYGSFLMQQMAAGREPVGKQDILQGLNRIYQKAATVNQGVIGRMRKAQNTPGDSMPNAVVLLASFSGLVPLTAERQLAELEKLFLGIEI